MAYWDYYGIFPTGAETSSPFWGVRGIVSTSGTYGPRGILTADQTEVETPAEVVISCLAVYTSAYQWYKKNGSSWEKLTGETDDELTVAYVEGDAGEYEYRCLCKGWAGQAYTDSIKITVSDPEPPEP